MGGESGSIISLVVLLVVFGGIFYFLLIRPQRKKQQQHEDLIEQLQQGDQIVTAGGIHGSIIEVLEDTFVVVIGEGTTIEIEKDSVAEKATDEDEEEKSDSGGND